MYKRSVLCIIIWLLVMIFMPISVQSKQNEQEQTELHEHFGDNKVSKITADGSSLPLAVFNLF
ncbi:hypothetical protein [Alkalicoccobacillus porphyridii]|uniref:Uncharacterized protein n=1 Tax=Alkalicoccobacillus porphyridii TaxID=2597270 RepID=A0A554A076_9BACI|nr:hypothetical protein [Alkalicoccobacillus porphyridii]TSB47099.1 hypothetical protein FN960_08780 [Alkalicoccobacillus porphyridii]